MLAEPSALAGRVAAWGVASEAPMASAPLEPDRWSALLAAVKQERLEGLLARVVVDGGLPVDQPQYDEVLAAAHGAASLAVRLERRLLLAVAVLDRAGIDYRVLKGPALAHTIYPDPAMRGFGDIDLLIPSASWDRAVAAFEADGYRRTLPEVRARFDRRFGKEATLVGPDLLEVDFHRTLVIGPLGLTIDLADLFAGCTPFRLGGRTLPALDAETRLLHACYTAAVADDPPQLRTLRDVAQMLLTTSPNVGRLRRLARSWRGEEVVRRALHLTTEWMGGCDGAVAADWVDQLDPPRFDRWLVSTYLGPARSYTSQAASLLVIPGMIPRLAYLRALLFPQPEYLARRGFTLKSHWRRGFDHLRPPGRAS